MILYICVHACEWANFHPSKYTHSLVWCMLLFMNHRLKVCNCIIIYRISSNTIAISLLITILISNTFRTRNNITNVADFFFVFCWAAKDGRHWLENCMMCTQLNIISITIFIWPTQFCVCTLWSSNSNLSIFQFICSTSKDQFRTDYSTWIDYRDLFLYACHMKRNINRFGVSRSHNKFDNIWLIACVKFQQLMELNVEQKEVELIIIIIIIRIELLSFGWHTLNAICDRFSSLFGSCVWVCVLSTRIDFVHCRF